MTVPTTEPPHHLRTGGKDVNAWQRICHVQTERVNVFQESGAIWCVVETPAGGRQEDGFNGPARKWQKWEGERSESGDVSRTGREVRWFTAVVDCTCSVPMLQSPVGSRVTHKNQGEIFFIAFFFSFLCFFGSTMALWLNLVKWISLLYNFLLVSYLSY